MDAKPRKAFHKPKAAPYFLGEEAGQSLFEFLMLLPMLLGMTIILIRINTAIQISIVDQQYARAQALFLAFNSPYYPALELKLSYLIPKSSNQMLVGVSDNSPGSSKSYTPKATVEQISRKKNTLASNEDQIEPLTRSNVRIRNSVTLCTESLFLPSQGGASTPILNIVQVGNGFNVTGSSALSQNGAVGLFQNICGSKLKYEQ